MSFCLLPFFLRLIYGRCLQVHVVNLVGQPLGSEHLHLASKAHQVAAEIYRRTHEEFEIREILSLDNLMLALVYGKVSQVIPLIPICPDDNPLSLGVIADKHAIALLEVLLRIKVRINPEFDVGQFHIEDPVEGEHPEVVRLRLLLRSVTVKVPQDIPTLLEELRQ